MRVASETSVLDVQPGDTTELVVEIVNTSEVIDGVSTRVIGLPEPSVTSSPAMLPLFPQTSGHVTLSLAVPPTHPAGQHSLTIEVTSHGAGVAPQFLDLDLVVAPRPAMTMATRPRMIRAYRQARFVLEITNSGNLPLDVTLQAVDVDRSCVASFAPDQLRIAAGSVVPVLLTVSGPRMVFGADLDRTITVQALARTVDAARPRAEPDAAPEAAPEEQLTQQITVRLRQRPRITRGLLTALILAGIIALWAAVFLLGLNKVFSGDPMTKAVPASFFAAGNGTGGSGAGGDGSGSGNFAGVQTGDGAAPAGALPKDGQVPAGIGGGISGQVIAASDHQPVGRILVEALRDSPDGLQVVSSAATQSDGTYALAGLFPTDYFLRFSAAGYRAVWYPAGPFQLGAKTVAATAQSVSDGIDVTITGNPASISGTVDPGDTLTPVHTTVVARSLEGSGGTTPVATTTTSAGGTYTLPKLPAPGKYELTFTATGYEPTTIVDSVAGGQKRLEPTVQLAVGVGEISGTVTDGTAPLGGAAISTTVGGKALALTTPTTGTVGAFLLGNLPTPATYVITFSRPGYGTQTQVIDLGAGQNRNGLKVALAAGTGSVSGRLVGSDGKGLGGATVTVGGATAGSAPSASPGAGPSPSPGTAAPVPTTTTLTSGAVGTFAINGLAAPGSYTLTFTLAGYAPATVPVTLTASGPPSTVSVTLSTQLGRISGQVTSADGAYVGATVTATDGTRSWKATSTSSGAGLPAGGYIIDQLQPGTYAVTVTAPAMTQQTALVTVTAGETTTRNLRLGG